MECKTPQNEKRKKIIQSINVFLNEGLVRSGDLECTLVFVRASEHTVPHLSLWRL